MSQLFPILVGHGSPDPAACAELAHLRAAVASELAQEVGLGVLEFPTPLLQQAGAVLDLAAEAGARGVILQPLLLFEGLHGQADLPALAARAEALGLEVRRGTPFGDAAAIADLMVERLRQREPSPADRLLFVGRGSSQPRALAQTERVAASVATRAGMAHQVCYTGISQPDLAEGARLSLAHRPRRLLVLPYLLHTGVLVRRAQQVIGGAAAPGRTLVEMLPHIGNAGPVVSLVADRLRQLAAGSPAASPVAASGGAP